ncbi:hypothetical protein Glove_22g119 [Diversispora epigaea]|uniref:Uncharacterized protein n=1 Tax=Diversispora epigaea TaxID=1348612 RepID=A0A397JLM5_9GLOM|nr:hypothetical protein Glove_22g119 [Diversispora epigaea]
MNFLKFPPITLRSTISIKQQQLTRQLQSIRQLQSTRQYATRQYATNETNQEIRKEGFGAPIWRNSLIVCLVGFAWYHLDKYITKSGENKHPITELIESWMTPDAEWRRITLNNLAYKTKTAEDTMLMLEARPPPMYRLRYPEQFESMNPFLIEPGTDVDLSDLVVKTYYDDVLKESDLD